VVEHLPSKRKALGSVTSSGKKKKRKKRKEKKRKERVALIMVSLHSNRTVTKAIF